MPRGGARVNSGPAPDPTALRRERPSDKAEWRTLPAEGRKGRAPAWPLPPELELSAQLELATRQQEILEAQIEAGVTTKSSVSRLAALDQKIAVLQSMIKAAADMEKKLWARLWSTPQAQEWERLRWTNEVALYARWQVRAELGDLAAAKEARAWSNLLGLNPAAMRSLRWKVAEPGPTAAAASRPKTTTSSRAKKPTTVKGRLKVIEGGGS